MPGAELGSMAPCLALQQFCEGASTSFILEAKSNQGSEMVTDLLESAQ